jgi:hypothetical protein
MAEQKKTRREDYVKLERETVQEINERANCCPPDSFKGCHLFK